MRICYLDESGHCGRKLNKKQQIEVVAGVITDASKLFKTQTEHQEILDVIQSAGVSVSEIKSSEIYRGRKEWSSVSPKTRSVIIEAFLNWASERKCKFLACPIDSSKFFAAKSAGCELSNLLCFPYEAAAMNAVLAIQRDSRSKKKNKGRTIVIFDEQKGHDESLLRLLGQDLSFTDGFTGYSAPPRAKAPPRLDQIVDVPHFSKSHQTVLIQLADIAAFIVSSHCALSLSGEKEKYLGEKKKIARWYSMVGENLITHTSIDPPGKDPLCQYYRKIRPTGWTAKAMAGN